MNSKYNVVLVHEPLDNEKAYKALYADMGIDADKSLSMIVHDPVTLQIIDFAIEQDMIETLFVRSQCKTSAVIDRWKGQGVKVSYVL